jgi:uncharacterized Zn finger protein (UPF0148 family)
MDTDKYNRYVSLLCPTCGCTEFECAKGVDETIQIVKCASCGRTLTKDELVEWNSENLLEHGHEIASQVADELIEEMQTKLRKTFSGNKYIRIK